MSARVETIILGMGCFWGTEKRMSAIPGVIDVESGYANGEVEGSYKAVIDHEHLLQRGRSTLRNHAEVVKITFDPTLVSLATILARFWESHDPTQGHRQGNDVGSNYRSAIYTVDAAQLPIAIDTRNRYQEALTAAGRGRITTEIEPLTRYSRAEEYHQDYLQKNPYGYCGLGGTSVPYPIGAPHHVPSEKGIRLIAFIHAASESCQRLQREVLAYWQADIPLSTTYEAAPPSGWRIKMPVTASPTVILFSEQQEISRHDGYTNAPDFWQWLGHQTLSPTQQRIAFEHGTEPPFSGAHLDESRPGTFVDPVTGAPLFHSETKFESGCGWPSFFQFVDGALTFHEDQSYGMHRTEVRSASSGIHLGHVFDDGPPPTGLRYCINGNVLRFIPDTE